QQGQAVLLAKGVVDQIAAVAGQMGERPDLGGDALHRLEDGMEVVLLKEFSMAKLQHVGVDPPLGKCGVQPVGPLQGLVNGSSGVGRAQLSVVAEYEAT